MEDHAFRVGDIHFVSSVQENAQIVHGCPHFSSIARCPASLSCSMTPMRSRYSTHACACGSSPLATPAPISCSAGRGAEFAAAAMGASVSTAWMHAGLVWGQAGEHRMTEAKGCQHMFRRSACGAERFVINGN